MLVEVCFLSECLVTIFLRAFKWTFASVRPQVIKKVVPFTEYHLTLLVVALHNAHPTVCLCVLVLKHTESSGLWDVIVNNIKFRKVNLVALVNF